MNRAKSMCMVLVVVLLAGAGLGQEAPKKWAQTFQTRSAA